MSSPYCGAGKLPKGKRHGTMTECVEKRQIRRYGEMKVDKKTMEIGKNKNVVPETREKLILKMVSLKGLIKRHKGRAETSKNEEIRKESEKIWKKAEKDLVPVVNKLKKIEANRSK